MCRGGSPPLQPRQTATLPPTHLALSQSSKFTVRNYIVSLLSTYYPQNLPMPRFNPFNLIHPPCNLQLSVIFPGHFGGQLSFQSTFVTRGGQVLDCLASPKWFEHALFPICHFHYVKTTLECHSPQRVGPPFPVKTGNRRAPRETGFLKLPSVLFFLGGVAAPALAWPHFVNRQFVSCVSSMPLLVACLTVPMGDWTVYCFFFRSY